MDLQLFSGKRGKSNQMTRQKLIQNCTKCKINTQYYKDIQGLYSKYKTGYTYRSHTFGMLVSVTGINYNDLVYVFCNRLADD